MAAQMFIERAENIVLLGPAVWVRVIWAELCPSEH